MIINAPERAKQSLCVVEHTIDCNHIHSVDNGIRQCSYYKPEAIYDTIGCSFEHGCKCSHPTIRLEAWDRFSKSGGLDVIWKNEEDDDLDDKEFTDAEVWVCFGCSLHGSNKQGQCSGCKGQEEKCEYDDGGECLNEDLRHIAWVEWLHENDYPWTKDDYELSSDFDRLDRPQKPLCISKAILESAIDTAKRMASEMGCASHPQHKYVIERARHFFDYEDSRMASLDSFINRVAFDIAVLSEVAHMLQSRESNNE